MLNTIFVSLVLSSLPFFHMFMIFYRLDVFSERVLISFYVLIIIIGVIGNITLGTAFLTNKVKL